MTCAQRGRVMKILIVLIMSLSSVCLAKNKCYCLPTTGKDYIGEARKKSAFGFSIHWVCDYECNSSMGARELVKGSYKKFYAKKSEDGREGICEGMKYKPEFNFNKNEYVYMWDGKTNYFSPKRSAAKELTDWAEQNDCD